MANYKKMVDGVEIELTDDEQKEREAEEKAWDDAAPARAFEGLRNERNEKLAETDWTVLSDTSLSDDDKKKWTDYRKVLRDLPAQYDNSSVLGDITWPSKP